MTTQPKSTEEKYLDEKIGLIRAIINGYIAGALMFGKPEQSFDITEKAMKLIEKDIRNIFNYAKRIKKSNPQ